MDKLFENFSLVNVAYKMTKRQLDLSMMYMFHMVIIMIVIMHSYRDYDYDKPMSLYQVDLFRQYTFK